MPQSPTGILRRLRERSGLSQEKAATSIRIGDSYLSRIESMKRVPSVTVLDALLELYGASPAERSIALATYGRLEKPHLLTVPRSAA